MFDVNAHPASPIHLDAEACTRAPGSPTLR
jgi:hypothetical protein